MLLEIEVDENARVARLRGELDLSTVEALTRAVAPLVATGGDVVLEMEAVAFVDSTGLHALLGIAATLGPGGRVTLRRPRRTLERLIELAGVRDRFDVVEPCQD